MAARATSAALEGHRTSRITQLVGTCSPAVNMDVAVELMLAWNERNCRPPLAESKVIATCGGIAKRSKESPMNTDDDGIDELREQQENGETKRSKATILVDLAISEGAELFHTPEGEAFATVPVDGRRETWPLRTKTVRRWLARLFYLNTGRRPTRTQSRTRSACSRAKPCLTSPSTPSTFGSPGTTGRSISISPMPSGAQSRSPRLDGA